MFIAGLGPKICHLFNEILINHHVSEIQIQQCSKRGARPAETALPASMLIFLTISLTLLVKVPVEGERCGTNNLGFRCQGDGECWEEEFVCDGYEQCADGSDEGTADGQGCNLYPDSGCVSNNGKEHYKCKRTQECFNSKEDADKCDKGEEVDNGGCKEDEFKCLGGRCIPKYQVCDGTPHCKESNDTGGSSDEWIVPPEGSESFRPGCNFYNDTSAQPPCRSLYGYHYSRYFGKNVKIKIEA